VKKILFLLFSLLIGPAFIALAQESEVKSVKPPSTTYEYSGVKDVKPPTINIQPAMPVTQPIRIEVGHDIAKSVEIKQVPGNEIKVLPPAATVIYTPPPEAEVHGSHGGHAAHTDQSTTTPTPTPTPSPRTTP
jgi:hypothetical protein